MVILMCLSNLILRINLLELSNITQFSKFPVFFKVKIHK